MMMKKNKLLMLFLLLLIIGEAVAQPTHRATLRPVEVAGFYAIDLSALLLGIAAPDKRDIRIQSDSGEEIPWLLQESVEQQYVNEVTPFQIEIASTTHQTDLLIAANKAPLAAFSILIKNAEVYKKATLLGSDDAEKWFAVKEKIHLTNAGKADKTEVLLHLDFPLSDYAYYKLSINDSLSAPLNIVKVVTLKQEYTYKQNLMEIPLQNYSITKDGKRTVITAVFPFKYETSDISFYISSPTYFNRILRRGKSEYSIGTLSSADKATGDNALQIAHTHYTDTLIVSIYNGDDQPLSIDSLKVYTHKAYIVAPLKAGISYALTFGDTARAFPQYDLSFATQLSDSIPHIAATNIAAFPTQAAEPENRWLALLKEYGIWIIIGFVIIQILYMVRKML